MADTYFAQSKLLWKHPRPELTQVENLRRYINRKHGFKLANYHDLHKYSVEEDSFWLDLWECLNIISSVPPEKSPVYVRGLSEEVPIWFPAARLNYAQNLLWRMDDGIAITASGESGIITNYTYRELNRLVREMAAALRVSGLKVGDRVATIVSNTINPIVIALAVASTGGIYSSTAPDMGTEGILDRYAQIQPKFVFAETEVVYAGKIINLLPKITGVVNGLAGKGLQSIILFPSRVSGKELTSDSIPNSMSLSAFLAKGDNRKLEYEQLPFSQPLYILYSSGTSGKPKCIVHSAGGVLMQNKKDIKFSSDVTSEETYFQYTTTGWMMWVYMLGNLSIGGRIILWDGSPFFPSVETYLKFVSDQGVTVLGTSPRFLAEVQGRGINPLKIASFEALRLISSTGAVLTPPMFEWTQQAFGGKIFIASPSGGTDICAAFVGATPALPVYSGETQCKALGMKVEIFDPAGNNIEHTGQPGEMVCTRPHPSLPVRFWGDEDGKKFRETYYSMFPGVWRQGDFMVVNPATKGIVVLGRSDGVLNPSGVRFGSGEIYSVMEQFSSSIDDSLCVGQRRSQDNNERVLLFLKMRPGHRFTPELTSKIRQAIRKNLSARHVPAYIFEISDIPYTVNGKKIEIAVKQIVSGSNMKPSGTVANPESLQLYYKYRDIEQVVGVGKAKL